MTKNIKRINAIIHGKVQGVFFRETTCQKARKLGLSGWVKNLSDGTVETEFQGDEKAVKQLLEWLWEGSPMSKVTQVISQESDAVSEESEFTVTF